MAWRLIYLIRAGWRYDYDEGMVGLQVLRILDGARPVFHPGQPYLGAFESYLIAPIFSLAGASAVTLKLIPWLLSGGYIATTGWLGARAFGRRVALLSALLAAFPPTYLLVTGLKTWGATAETLLLGHVVLIASSYVVDPRASLRTQARAAAALAFAAGLGFWISWLIAFFVLPAATTLAIWGRRPLRRAGLWLVAGFLAGSAPLWLFNLQHDFATFRYLLRAQGDTWGNALRVLDHLSYDLAPRLVSGDPAWRVLSWPAVWWLQIVYQAGMVSVLVAGMRASGRSGKGPTRALLAMVVVTVPLLYLLSGYGNRALNEFGFDATGRYVLMLHALLPVGAAALAVALGSRGRRRQALAASVVASVVAFNLLGALRADPVQVFTSPYYARQPSSLAPLISYLDERAIRHVWTDVGVAHVLMFETQGQILAADWYDIYGARGLLRFPEVPQAIAAAERVAFVEVILPGQTSAPLEEAFKRSGVAYSSARPAPDLLVIVPESRLDPAAVAEGMGYQF